MPSSQKTDQSNWKLRKPLSITHRVSSITNGFVQAIIPDIPPAPGEIEAALRILGMTYDNRSCVYCGILATDWDHLRPLVKGKRPTGYVNEIRNLVPACGPCNQSKGGADWLSWMTGPAKGSPTTKQIHDLEDRIGRLNNFVRWGNVQPLPLEALAGSELWHAHWENLARIEQAMKVAQQHAAKIRVVIAEAKGLDQPATIPPV